MHMYNDVHYNPPKVIEQKWQGRARGIKRTCQIASTDADCLNEWRRWEIYRLSAFWSRENPRH